MVYEKLSSSCAAAHKNRTLQLPFTIIGLGNRLWQTTKSKAPYTWALCGFSCFSYGPTLGSHKTFLQVVLGSSMCTNSPFEEPPKSLWRYLPMHCQNLAIAFAHRLTWFIREYRKSKCPESPSKFDPWHGQGMVFVPWIV